MDEPTIISAREAMLASQSRALQGDLDGARFWLDFAREVREEHYARKSWEAWDVPPRLKIVAPAPDPDVLAGTDQPRQSPYFGEPTRGQRLDNTQQLKVPVPRPGEAIEGDGTRCKHCGNFLKQVSDNGYVHTRTGQAVCPYPAPGGPDDTVLHTFATPE